MKQITILLTSLLFIGLAIFSGCSKDEENIEKWIIGTWDIDRYVQQDIEDGVVTSESESTDQGEIVFRDDGTGEDIGGNFSGSVFTWTNTDTTLEITQGQTTTIYDIETFSSSIFIFSITEEYPDKTSIERWYFSK